MDKEQEDMQFLGLFGIYKESCKIRLQWKKLFAQIALTLVSDALFSGTVHDSMALDAENYDKLSDCLDKETAVYFASVYAGQEVSYKKVMRVVPRVRKKLMAIFLLLFPLICIYNIGIVVFFFACQSIISPKNAGTKFHIVLGGFYWVGLVVVAVLEEASYTGHAIDKSHALIKGKLRVASLIFWKFNLLLGLIQLGFQNVVLHGNNTVSMGFTSRVAFGVLCCLLLCALILFKLVVYTVVCFVCKSHHREKVNKLALSDHLEVYLGEYVPLVSMDVQLEQYNV
ncbi:hypothetical protein ACJRO7_024651 [Eucalyptus globulus]|uniref:Uncharacterized protein n=1 Tax=Eucalyptus globulus TaxID=34317 RepID=A0ABD3K697_EUCGL